MWTCRIQPRRTPLQNQTHRLYPVSPASPERKIITWKPRHTPPRPLPLPTCSRLLSDGTISPSTISRKRSLQRRSAKPCPTSAATSTPTNSRWSICRGRKPTNGKPDAPNWKRRSTPIADCATGDTISQWAMPTPPAWMTTSPTTTRLFIPRTIESSGPRERKSQCQTN
jgi:hypothetical protein